MAAQANLDKMQLRQNYRNIWHTDLMSTIRADFPYCCLALWCGPCVSYMLRKRALYNDMSRYVCCAGYLPCSGRCGESRCPELCLGTEVFLCFGNSVASTRFLIQDEFNIQTTQCDNCIIGFMFCLQQLACIFSLVACIVGSSELQEASQILSCLADFVYCTVCAQALELARPLSGEEALDLRETSRSLKQALAMLEIKWQQKSRIKWLEEGDQNTKFFHRSTLFHRKANRILSLQNVDGMIVSSREEMENILTSHFKTRWSGEASVIPPASLDKIPCIINSTMNLWLTRPFTNKEIFEVVSRMPTNKAPGPDGFTAEFFSSQWETVGPDLCKGVLSFFRDAAMPPKWKDTYITLIPKTSDPSTPKHFRPISLCNTVYKVITKLLANRLKRYLPLIISEEQSAFVAGRSITENILLAQEIAHSMEFEQDNGRSMALKLDMEHAYDRLSWSFIASVLEKFGFSRLWIKWIMGCICRTAFSILLNGSPTRWFRSSRGLRQGDPLAPYLYLLASEALHRSIADAHLSGALGGIRPAPNVLGVPLLAFADDIVVFIRASLVECDILLKILNTYCEASGQKVNGGKSSILFGKGVHPRHRRLLTRKLGFQECRGPVSYLGVTIWGRPIPADTIVGDFIEKFSSKLSGWRAGNIAFPGKIVLLRSVLSAMPIHCMAASWIPQRAVNAIEKLMRSFLWANKSEGKGIHLVKWSTVCLPLAEGGLGVRRLDVVRRVLLSKCIFALAKGASSPWCKFVKAKYSLEANPWRWARPRQCSRVWRSILEALPLVRDHLWFPVCANSSLHAVTDPWISNIPLSHSPSHFNVADANFLLDVGELLDGENRWDSPLVEAIFGRSLAKRILSLPVLDSSSHGNIAWGPRGENKFSLKDAYKLAIGEDEINASEPSFSQWKSLWNTEATPRAIAFTWKVLRRAIPTKDLLNRRGMDIPPYCDGCEDHIETINHALFSCPSISVCWNSLTTLAPHVGVIESLADWIHVWSSAGPVKIFHIPLKSILVSALWSIWRARCDRLFEGRHWNPSSIISRCVADIPVIPAITNPITPPLQVPNVRLTQWTRPGPGWCKLNFDGSVSAGQQLAAGGYICRDPNGEVLGAGAGPCGVCHPLYAELYACWLGVKFLTNCLGSQSLWIEGDSKSIVDCLIQGKGDHFLFDDILRMLSHFPAVKISHIPRAGNKSADWIAKWGLCLDSPKRLVEPFPPQFASILCVEKVLGGAAIPSIRLRWIRETESLGRQR